MRTWAQLALAPSLGYITSDEGLDESKLAMLECIRSTMVRTFRLQLYTYSGADPGGGGAIARGTCPPRPLRKLAEQNTEK